MQSYEAMRQAAIDAIRVAAVEAFQRVEKKSVFGFALCTDNDLGGVFHTYATRDWVSEREPEYPGIGFIPVEWEQGYDGAPFLELSKTFFEISQSDRHLPHAAYEKSCLTRFRILVEAMRICRDEGLFDPNTLLCVGGTDPEAILVEWTCHAARYLNKAEIAEEYCRTI